MWSTLDAARCDTIPIRKLMPRSIYDELYWHYIQMTCNGRFFASSVDRLLAQRDARSTTTVWSSEDTVRQYLLYYKSFILKNT